MHGVWVCRHGFGNGCGDGCGDGCINMGVLVGAVAWVHVACINVGVLTWVCWHGCFGVGVVI